MIGWLGWLSRRIGWLSVGLAAYECIALLRRHRTVSHLSKYGHPAVRALIWLWLAGLNFHLFTYKA